MARPAGLFGTRPRLEVTDRTAEQPRVAEHCGRTANAQPRGERPRRHASHAVLCSVVDAYALFTEPEQTGPGWHVFRSGGEPARAGGAGRAAGVWGQSGAVGSTGQRLFSFAQGAAGIIARSARTGTTCSSSAADSTRIAP